jgi:hypothetical protein
VRGIEDCGCAWAGGYALEATRRIGDRDDRLMEKYGGMCTRQDGGLVNASTVQPCGPSGPRGTTRLHDEQLVPGCHARSPNQSAMGPGAASQAPRESVAFEQFGVNVVAPTPGPWKYSRLELSY